MGSFLSYQFKNPKLLEEALTHKSFGNEARKSGGARDNERFEFLGDAVLDLIVSEKLVSAHPKAAEGELSKWRAAIVNERSLALLARHIELGKKISLGKGEEATGGRAKDSILSSTLEAVIAAIYLDSGFEKAREVVLEMFGERVFMETLPELHQDHKTKLQEFVQAKFRAAPKYATVKSEGPDHNKTFHVELSLNGRVLSVGSGRSKKEAEQAAARQVLERIDDILGK